MTVGTIAMLVGVFGVPAALLRLGHRLRRRTPAQRAMFWGASIGYLVAACAALFASMVPAETWSSDDKVRGLLGFWGLLIGPAIGAAIGFVHGKGVQDA